MALPCSIMKCMSQTSDDIADADADANGIPIAANRRVLVLRALRIGGLVAVLPSMILAVVWWNNFPLPPDLLRSFLQLLLPLPALWVASGLVRKVCHWFEEEFAHTIWRRARKFFASLVAVYTIAVTGWHVHRWWHFYAGFSFSIIVLLTLAASCPVHLMTRSGSVPSGRPRTTRMIPIPLGGGAAGTGDVVSSRCWRPLWP